jgi:hypothetical protein
VRQHRLKIIDRLGRLTAGALGRAVIKRSLSRLGYGACVPNANQTGF